MPDEIIRRYEGNPVLTAEDVPYHATLVFNAGVAKFRGRYVMVFRNDYSGDDAKKVAGTNLGLATSDDGLKWEVAPEPCFSMGSDTGDDEIRRAYDPRLTVIDGRAYMCFAVDTRHGIRGGIAVTDDLREFEVLSLSAPDNRNMVLFPEKIGPEKIGPEKTGAKYARLERPFPIYGRGAPEAFDIWFSDSPDLKYWGNTRLVLGAEQVPFANCKIGPAAPPVRTEHGWLTVIHAVHKDTSRELPAWHEGWFKRYMAGVALLDLEEPWRVVGMSREPLLDPDERFEYEMKGYRGSVIFPTGVILEPDGEVKIYYGAADTVMALATAKLDDLVALCEPV